MRTKKGTNFSPDGELLTPERKKELREPFASRNPIREMKEGDRVRVRLFVVNEQREGLHGKTFLGTITKILRKGGKLEVLVDGEEKPRLTVWRMVRLESDYLGVA